jgi:hypothetical protein
MLQESDGYRPGRLGRSFYCEGGGEFEGRKVQKTTLTNSSLPSADVGKPVTTAASARCAP